MLPHIPEEPGGEGDGEGEASDEADGLRELETFGGSKDVAGDDDGHEDGGEEGYPAVAPSAQEPYGCSPEEAGGECLVGPSEVAPENVEVHEDESGGDGEEGQGEEQSVAYLLLIQVHKVRHDKAGTAVGGVA